MKSRPQTPSREFDSLQKRVIECRLCPRLVAHREAIARIRTRRFADEDYWGRPVPAFGVSSARLLVVGLAPAAHGANRTGRMFTGDRSGDWLYEALHRFGFASQAQSVTRSDGLKLIDACITAAGRCAPPSNKPTREELELCRTYLEREIHLLRRMKVVIALGRIGFDSFLKAWQAAGRPLPRRRPAFGHGSSARLDGDRVLLGSYHPSQQNTFTGRLTRAMFHRVFRKARRILDEAS